MASVTMPSQKLFVSHFSFWCLRTPFFFSYMWSRINENHLRYRYQLNDIQAKSFAFPEMLRVQWLASKLIQPRQCHPGVASNVFRVITYAPTYKNIVARLWSRTSTGVALLPQWLILSSTTAPSKPSCPTRDRASFESCE